METIERSARETSQRLTTPIEASDYAVVGRVETCATLLGQIYVRTSRGALVRVTTTPLTVLRSRRRRGMAWSETKFVRLVDVREGARVMVRGAVGENGASLRAAIILVGDIARFVWCRLAAVDAPRREVTLLPSDGAPIVVELADWTGVRELATSRVTRAPQSRSVQHIAALDEAGLERLSTDLALENLSPDDAILALIEPTPTVGLAIVARLYRASESRRRTTPLPA